MGSFKNSVSSRAAASFSIAARYRSAASVRYFSRFWIFLRRSYFAISRSILTGELTKDSWVTGGKTGYIQVAGSGPNPLACASRRLRCALCMPWTSRNQSPWANTYFRDTRVPIQPFPKGQMLVGIRPGELLLWLRTGDQLYPWGSNAAALTPSSPSTMTIRW